MNSSADHYWTQILQRRWLSNKTFEIRLKKPPTFTFEPGQRICLSHNTVARDYSLVCPPDDPDLLLCIRNVKGGLLSPELSALPINSQLHFTGPDGYFVFRPSIRPAVFVATGTGIAPFCSMVRAGITEVTLLHGVATAAELYYTSVFESLVKRYVPCLSQPDVSSDDIFGGMVTEYLQRHLAKGRYDFYLCGRQQMIRDVTLLVDEKFEGSYLYTELFD